MAIVLRVMVPKTFHLTKEEAKHYITDAKVHQEGLFTPLIDIYTSYRGCNHRIATIEAPKDFNTWDKDSVEFDDRLLEYAKNNLPDDLFINRT